jgi:hypothetical protein
VYKKWRALGAAETERKEEDEAEGKAGRGKEAVEETVTATENNVHSSLADEYEYFHDESPSKNQKFRSLHDIMADSEPMDAVVAELSSRSDSSQVDLDLISDSSFPLSVADAIKGPDGVKWIEAMQSELNSLIRNNTWDLVPRPGDRRIISNKWVLTKKYDANGVLLRFKARLVARGFTRVPGLDFTDTFAPTLKSTPRRLLFALTAGLNLELHHLDIETAFLHGDLDEDIYMEQPPYFVDPQFPQYVCKLKKSLYGLKQSPRMWHLKLHTYLTSIGFVRLQAEPNLYIRKEDSVFTIIGVYVDDIPIASNSSIHMKKAINQLKEKFPVKDLGSLEYFLGIKVTRNRVDGTLTLSQRKLLHAILLKYEMADCKPIHTPMIVACKLSMNDCPSTPTEEEFMATLPYRQILGSIRYLVSCTRPDLSYCAGFLSRFMHNPGIAHWQPLKRVLRYLQYTKDTGITYHNFQLQNSSHRNGYLQAPLCGWSDSDWGGDIDTSRSTSGMVFLFAGGAISWRSKRQDSVALSSTEAEYIAAALTSKEGLWIKTICEELDIFKLSEVKIYCDNQSCIKLAENPKITDQNKHI